MLHCNFDHGDHCCEYCSNSCAFPFLRCVPPSFNRINMTLSFSTQWPATMGDLAGQPNYFIEKIWSGLLGKKSIEANDYLTFQDVHKDKFKYDWDTLDIKDFLNCAAKIHTIRAGDRWRPGMKIHPVINNRTKDRFQFAPVLEVKSVQDVVISYRDTNAVISIDGRDISGYEEFSLALKDGFPSVEAFFKWFDKEGVYQLIHWTDFKY